LLVKLSVSRSRSALRQFIFRYFGTKSSVLWSEFATDALAWPVPAQD